MTKKRFDLHSTEFGLWVREQPEIDSFLGYRNYNLDIIWWKKNGLNKEPEKWMMIEEKRYMSECKGDQRLTFQFLHSRITKLKDETYFGLHLLQFENTNPDDGKIFWDRKQISKEQLLNILQFK